MGSDVKKGLKNILYGVLGQIILIVAGLMVPRLVLVNFGSEINGLINSINQMFAYLALMEAGIGTATIQALYGPIATRNRASINSIMAATHNYYRKVGKLYFAAIIILASIYPIVVNTEIDSLTITLIILLNGMVGVINFYFMGKYSLLLRAEGKSYIITNLMTVVSVLNNIAKLVLLMLGFNILLVQATYVIINFLHVLYMVFHLKKNYKWLILKVKPDYMAISQKNSAFMHEIAGFVYQHADVLLLTLFCDLKVVSVYSLYNMMFSMIAKLIQNINSGVTFKLGQVYNSNKEHFMKLHNMYEICNMIIVFSSYTVATIFILPFLKIYTFGIKDINYIDTNLLILFAIIPLLTNGRTSSGNAINYAGHFKQTRWRPIIELTINLSVSICLLSYLGIYGVLIGTVIATLYRTNDIILYTCQNILNINPWRVYKRWMINIIVFSIIIFFSSKIYIDLSNYLLIIVYAAIYLIIITVIFVIIQYIFNRDIFIEIIEYVKPYLRRMLRKLKGK